MALDVSSCITSKIKLILISYYSLVLVGEDNPAWDGLFEFCSISAGGSISEWLHVYFE